MPHDFLTYDPKSHVWPVWDYRALIMALGSSTDIVRWIAEAGYDAPNSKTVDGWRWRGRVPSHWTPLLLDWALSRGIIKSVDDLRVKDKVTL